MGKTLAASINSAVFWRFFTKKLPCSKLVYIMLLLPTSPRVSRKNVKKVTKKVLTITEHDGIIYKSTRYGNKTKAKIVRHFDL